MRHSPRTQKTASEDALYEGMGATPCLTVSAKLSWWLGPFFPYVPHPFTCQPLPWFTLLPDFQLSLSNVENIKKSEAEWEVGQVFSPVHGSPPAESLLVDSILHLSGGPLHIALCLRSWWLLPSSALLALGVSGTPLLLTLSIPSFIPYEWLGTAAYDFISVSFIHHSMT